MSSVIMETVISPKIVEPNVTIPTTVFRSQSMKLSLIRFTRYYSILEASRTSLEASTQKSAFEKENFNVLSRQSRFGTMLTFPKATVRSFSEMVTLPRKALINPAKLIFFQNTPFKNTWYILTALDQRYLALLETTLISRYGIEQVMESLEKIMLICKQRRVSDVYLDSLTNFMAQKYLMFLQQRPRAQPKYMILMTMMTMLVLRGKSGMVYIAQTLSQAQIEATMLTRRGLLKNICDMVVDYQKGWQQEYPTSYSSSNEVVLDVETPIEFEEETRQMAKYEIIVLIAVLVSHDRTNLINTIYLNYNAGFKGGGGYPYFALDRKKKYNSRYNKIPKMFRAYSRLNRRRYQEMLYLTHGLWSWFLKRIPQK